MQSMPKTKRYATRLIFKALLGALVFAFAIPHINGAYFHGNYLIGVLFGIMIGLIHSAVITAVEYSYQASVDADIALPRIVLLPVVLIGCFLVPALELRILAAIFPATLGFVSWWAAIKSSLLIIVMILITRDPAKK